MYVKAFAHRLLPIFADIEGEADAAATEHYEATLLQSNSEGLGDPSTIAEWAQDHGITTYEDLYFVRSQLIGLAVAGLFHLWEKFSKDMFDVEVRHVTELPASATIQKWQFCDIRQNLKKIGFLIEEHIWKEIHIAGLLTNTIKHGGGRSCSQLAEIAPEFFDQDCLRWFKKTEQRVEWLKLAPEHFERFAECFVEYWKNMPRSITVELPSA